MPDQLAKSMHEIAKKNRLAKRFPTNADRIRSMSDEELAEFLIHDSENHAYLCCDCCTCGKPGMCTENTVCTLGVLDWLRQPAEEGHDGQ